MRKAALTVLSLLLLPACAWAASPLPKDPLGSPMWTYHAARLFKGAPVVFDPRVRLQVPMIAENQHQFPVTVDARTIPGASRIIIFADLNPLTQAVDFRPFHAAPFLSLRIKLDQRTPVRAAVMGADGAWHVSGVWVDAAGGGCSAPPVSRAKGDWALHLGEMRGSAWKEGDDLRLRVSLRHPMDTGLVENIPSFHIETIHLRDAAGVELANMTVEGSVSEDPAFTFLLRPTREGPVKVQARDSEGREYQGVIGLQSRPRG
ncbi:quinoprotein dehydrogenase-associated SoxYZ-like carrier [Novosphingobium sp. SG707]|uniref:quinoprotein dehydrogenase-associated SoxYZ-like carrier n=1 Tax=Novosphingobium sp. SG707 TaxID=2586996 RepID=UPI001446FFE7|nr:quinoprotein dehydrogenase-associated SoxYZ-like carrier [Novosphingobium sp. SG707]